MVIIIFLFLGLWYLYLQYDRRARAKQGHQAPLQEVLTHSTPQHSRVPSNTLPSASAVTFGPPPSDASDSSTSSSTQDSTLSSTISDSNPPAVHCTTFASTSSQTDLAPTQDSGVDTSPPDNTNHSIISRVISYLR